jgi:bifunctional ADP-heptose synthase (sugar kinase/adenylyltransferase)
MLGEKKEHLNFIKKNLSKNIFLNFIKKKESPTIVKTRFVDYISYSKIIGVYDLNDSLLSKKQELEISNLYKKQKKKSDILIIVDYGHGFISKKNVILASKKTKFVCVNSQINSSNAGYHDLKKYEKIDLLVINEKELRYEFRDAKSEIIFLMKKLSKLQNIKKIIVTQGRNGATLYDKKLNEIVKCPAFTDRIVDKVGAGDAMLAIVSMCLKKKISNEVSLLLGSLAAAFITENLGNKFHVNKVEILKALKHLGV